MKNRIFQVCESGHSSKKTLSMWALFVLISVFAIPHSLLGQNLEETLKNMPMDPAKEFVRPLADAFGANLNTGWINNAPSAKMMGLDLKLGVVFMGAFINSDEQVFQLLDLIFPFQAGQAEQLARSIPGLDYDNLDPTQKSVVIETILNTDIRTDVTGPTVFASEDVNLQIMTKATDISVTGLGDYTIPANTLNITDVRGILNDPGLFPTAAPQLTVGTVYGTQASFRYLPSIKLSEDVGSLKYFGFGVQHNPAVWFENPLPLNVSLGFFTQTLKIGDALEATTTAYGLNVSKTFGGFIASVTPYAGFLLENSTMDVNYSYQIAPGNTIDFNFEIDGVNSNRFLLGLGVNVFGVNLFADYNFASVNTVNVSLLYGF